MQHYLYRFRTASRLIEKGELENGEIYFASPEQLNDPLEGFLDIYWSGDSIVWNNLFKHYLFCLTQSVIDLYLFGEKITPDKNIKIPNNLKAANEEGQKLLDTIYSYFFSNNLMKEYIECLATIGRKIDRDELSSHLFTLHQQMFYCVYKAFEQSNMQLPSLSFLETLENDRQVFFKNIAIPFLREQAGQEYDFEDETFARSVFDKNQKWLQNQYQATGRKKKEHFDFIAVEFPDAFLRSLENLIYPKWYTACFMTNCENSAIWGSYGDNHRGICLQFKVDKTEKSYKIKLLAPVGYGREGVIKKPRSIEFREVIYDNKHSPIEFFRSLGNVPTSSLEEFWYRDEAGNISKSGHWLTTLDDESRNAHWKQFYDATTSKLKVWKDENEYRIVLHPSLYNLQAASDRTLKYEFENLEGIIFGIRTPDSEKVTIMKIIKKLCIENNRASFKFYQARYDRVDNVIAHYELDKLKL